MGIVADQVEDEVQPNSLQLSNQDVEPFSGELQQPKGDSVEQSLKVNNRKLSDESNEENKVLHICGVEDETDIRFQLPSSSSGMSLQQQQQQHLFRHDKIFSKSSNVVFLIKDLSEL